MKKNFLDFSTSIFSILIGFGFNLILLPIVLYFLPTNDIRLWYLFSSLTGIILVLSGALNQSFIRYLSYSKSNNYFDNKLHNDVKELSEFSVLFTGKFIFFFLSALTFLGLFFLGSTFLDQFFTIYLNRISWYIYLVSASINFLLSFYSSKLRANNLISLDNFIVIISRTISILFSLIFSFLGLGLFGLSIAFFIKSIVSSFLLYFCSRKLVKNLYNPSKRYFLSDIFFKDLILLLLSSSKQVLNNLSGWLINNGITLILANYISVSLFNSFSITLQVFGILASISGILFSNFSPQIAESIKLNNSNESLKYFSKSLILGYSIQSFGTIIILVFGNTLIRLFSNNFNLYFTITFLYSIFVFLELNQAIFSGFISLHNEFPFVKSSIISGILILGISYIGILYFGFELIHIIMTMLVIQGSYNFWKWPNYILRKYKLSLITLFLIGINDFNS